jgi:hypothetical protein
MQPKTIIDRKLWSHNRTSNDGNMLNTMDVEYAAPSAAQNIGAISFLRSITSSRTFQAVASIITALLFFVDTVLLGLGIDAPATYRRMSYFIGGLGSRLSGLVSSGQKGRSMTNEYELESESGSGMDDPDDGDAVRGVSSAVDIKRNSSNRFRTRRSDPLTSAASGGVRARTVFQHALTKH